MPDDVAELEARIRALTPDKRAALLRSLIAELDGGEDEGAEAAWLQKAEKRHRELLDGTVKAIPAETVFANLRKQSQLFDFPSR